MSREYPCIYFENDGKCRKFSDDNTLSYCVMGPCQVQTLSNADRIRAMNDDELSKQLVIVIDVDGLQPCKMYLSKPTGKIYLSRAKAVRETKDWLQQPAEED